MIQNPILRGFCPDPSIVRVGEDYYIAVSTFEWWPGVRLFHSRDLKNWSQLPSPLNRLSQLNMIGNPTSGGIWAPDITYDGERFYLVYTDVKTKKGRYYNNHNYLVWADNIEGPWSDPIYLNSTGFDPSMLHDSDGRKYIINMKNGFRGVLVQELDFDKKQLAGEVKNVFPGTELGFTEGPHIYHIGDWYYCLTAEGGTSYEHCVTIARSKSLWGPYEVDPDNPMLTSDRNKSDALQKCGHADITDTPSGEWYMVHLCSRPKNGKKYCLLGRETAIQNIYINEEGWFRLKSGGRFAQNTAVEPAGLMDTGQSIEGRDKKAISFRDDFKALRLNVCYSTPRVPLGDKVSLKERLGYLRLYGQESLNSFHNVSLIALKQSEYGAMAETCLEFSPDCEEQAAGLAYMYDAMNFYLFVKTRDKKGNYVLTLLKSDRGVITDEIQPVVLPDDNKLWLRIKTDEAFDQAGFFYSVNGTDFIDVNSWQSVNILTDEHCRGFTGAHFGMYCHDMTGKNKFADFDYFMYRE